MKNRAAARSATMEALYSHGWPRNADNRRYFCLKPYQRVSVAFAKGTGFYMHLEGDVRVAFGRDYDTALKALVRILEPGVERIVMAGEVEVGESPNPLCVPSVSAVATISV